MFSGVLTSDFQVASISPSLLHQIGIFQQPQAIPPKSPSPTAPTSLGVASLPPCCCFLALSRAARHARLVAARRLAERPAVGQADRGVGGRDAAGGGWENVGVGECRNVSKV